MHLSSRKVSVNIGRAIKEYEVIEEPYAHILVETNKELHGWLSKHRECTSERLLLNPYHGCSVGCFFCYTKGYDFGYFKLCQEEKVVTVFKDFDRRVASQLDEIKIASCGYLSPVSELFSELNNKYQITERIIKEFIKRNIPIEFITKEVISKEVLELLKQQRHSFGQVSILTLKEGLRKRLMKKGATTEQLLGNIRSLAKSGIYAVCRIDPILPFLNDQKEELRDLIKRVRDEGASHIIASCLDIPKIMYQETLNYIKIFGISIFYEYKKLYQESIKNCLHADINYRKRIFSFLRETCDKNNISFALCMEFEMVKDKIRGLNQEFMSSENCEGINIPIYIKRGKYFEPIADCLGNCLNCQEAKCGLRELSQGNEDGEKCWKLSDYKRWSKSINENYRLF
ncbi:radical SAM protein [bacterium]|nr:radical SAM protein [bacterium]